jgi:hypothetical protein
MSTFNAGQILTAAELEAIIDPPYGDVFLTTTQGPITTAVQLTPVTTGILNGFTVSSGNLVVPKTGIYLITFSVEAQTSAATLSWEGFVYKNGSPLIGSLGFFSAASQYGSVSGYVLASLTATDTLGLWASTSSGYILAQAGVGTSLNAVLIAST